MKKLLILILALVMCLSFTSCEAVLQYVPEDVLDFVGQYVPGLLPEEEVDPDAVIGGLYGHYNSAKYKNAKADYQVEKETNGVAVTWTSDSELVKVVDNGTSYTIDLPESNDTEVNYTLTISITVAGQVYSRTIKCVLPEYKEVLPTVNAPEEGVAYKIAMYQNNSSVNQLLFAIKDMDQDKYYKTTANPQEAPDFYVESAEGGFKFYYEEGEAKKYVEAYLVFDATNNKYSKRLRYSDNGTVWSYDAETNSWQTTLAQGEENVKYVFGTYSDFRTFCISEASYITAENTGTEQFPAVLMLKSVTDTIKPEHKCEHICVIEACGKCVDAECTEKACQDKCPGHSDLIPAADSTLTLEQAIAIGSAHIHNKYTEGKYYIVVTVEAITNETYGNMTVSNGTVSFTIYGTWSADGSLRYDAMENKPAVGDTVKLYGILGSYNKTAQMKNAWIVEITKPEVEVHTCESKCQFCKKCLDAECGEEACLDKCPGCTAVVPPVSVTAPAVNTPYHFGLTQVTINKNLYITGNTANQTYYLATTENLEEAIEVKLEAVDGVEGAYRIYFVKDGVKTYIRIYERDAANKKGSLELVTETPVEYYTFDTTYNTLVLTSGANKYYLGAYRDFATLSVSSYDYISSNGNFATQFYAVAGSETPAPHECESVCPDCGKCLDAECTETACTEKCQGHTVTPAPHECESVCPDCGKCLDAECTEDACAEKCPGHITIYTTAEEIMNAAYALEEGETLSDGHKYTLKGLVQSVDDAYNSQFSNVTVTILVEGTNKTLKCYRLKGTGADVIKAGDTITVTGVIKNYYGTIEFDAGCTLDSYVVGAPVETAGVTLSFANTSARTELSTSKQVWVSGDLKLTNDKAGSSSNVADYSNPARFYKNSTITIEYAAGIKTLTFTCDGTAKYQLTSGVKISVAGATIVQTGAVTTITFEEPVTSVTITLSVQQVRIKTLEVNK